jgi:hypothetical protein
MDKQRQLPDKSKKENEVIGGMHVVVPINRNLSKQLFGQLRMLIDKNR